jgi:hypothetical protein
VRHLRGLDDDRLRRVEPLPFRHVLGPARADELRARLGARFGVWYGGCPDRASIPEHLTFAADGLPAEAADALRALLGRRARRVFELGEVRPALEIDLALAALAGSEAFWFDGRMEWMVYASHEATLTVAGPALVADVRAELPHWLPHRLPG